MKHKIYNEFYDAVDNVVSAQMFKAGDNEYLHIFCSSNSTGYDAVPILSVDEAKKLVETLNKFIQDVENPPLSDLGPRSEVS